MRDGYEKGLNSFRRLVFEYSGPLWSRRRYMPGMYTDFQTSEEVEDLFMYFKIRCGRFSSLENRKATSYQPSLRFRTFKYWKKSKIHPYTYSKMLRTRQASNSTFIILHGKPMVAYSCEVHTCDFSKSVPRVDTADSPRTQRRSHPTKTRGRSLKPC